VIARLQQELGMELTVKDIFEASTLNVLAEQIINLKLAAFDSEELEQVLKEIQP
jgi:hypothetical protein